MNSFGKSWLFGLALASLMAALPAVAQAQRGGGGGPPGGGFFGGGGSESFLASNTDVQKELDLLDDQVAKIKEISDKQREGMRDLFTGMRDLTEEQRTAKMEEIRAKFAERSEDAKKQLASVLLPHQMKRLTEIARQQRVRAGGGSLSVDVIATELKLSDDQKEKLKAKAEEIAKQLREKMAQVRQDAENDILSVLTPDQRQQWKEMVGEPFEMQQPQFGGRTRGTTGQRPGN